VVVIQFFQAVTKVTPWRVSWRAVGWALAGLSVVALPWVTVISVRYGTLTVSTSARINYNLVAPPDVGRSRSFIAAHHAPEPGRITSWEEPNISDYNDWSPIGSAKAFRYQMWLAVQNAQRILAYLRNFDLIGLGLTSSVICFVFCTNWRVALQEQPWRLSVLIILVACGVYLPVFADDPRYYLMCFPLLLASALGFLRDFSQTAMRASGLVSQEKMRPFLTLGLVAVCFVSPLKNIVSYLRGEPTVGYQLAKELTASLGCTPGGPIASVGDRNNPPLLVGLYTAFLSGRAYYGNRGDAPSVGDVLSSKASVLIVEPFSKLDSALAVDPRVKLFVPNPPGHDAPNSSWPIRVYCVS
jgi:hypothetical protein